MSLFHSTKLACALAICVFAIMTLNTRAENRLNPSLRRTQTHIFEEPPKPLYKHYLSAPGAITLQQTKLQQLSSPEAEGLVVVSHFMTEFEKLLIQLKEEPNTFLEDDLVDRESKGASILNRKNPDVGDRRSPFRDFSELRSLAEVSMNSLRELAASGASSQRCVNDTGRLLIGMVERQGWALKFLDATGKLVPAISKVRTSFVGDYELCRSLVAPPSNTSAGFKGNYCSLKANVGPVNPNPLANLILQIGVCMPSTCTDTENTILFAEAVQMAGLNGTLVVLQAETHDDVREATTATYVAIVVVALLGLLMLVGTAYDLVFLQWPVWQMLKIDDLMAITNNSPDDHMDTTKVDDDDPLLGKGSTDLRHLVTPSGKLGRSLLAFSVYTNASKVLNTDQGPSSITCINGIRFISMTWVILGHTLAFGLPAIGNTASELPKLANHWTYDAVGNAFSSVDTFFTLSGLLTAYVTLTEMRKRGPVINWGLFYFHRFWRLTPPYMICILLVLGFSQYFGEGPLWPKVMPEDADVCRKYWWTNLLYVQNLVHKDLECFNHAWYLANDMQFFWVSPLMLVPLYFHKWIGIATCGVFLLVSMVTTGVISVQKGWPTNMAMIQVPGWQSFFPDYYIAPWCRIGPFIVGIVAGYLLAFRSRLKLKLNTPMAVIGWLSAAATALAVLYGLRGDISGRNINSDELSAFYNAASRSAWGVCVCWVILACSSGWGSFINTFLSWSPFVVLGRLTYMAYLIHPTIIHIFYYNQRTLFFLTPVSMSVTFMGILLASYASAFVLMLALESPMIGLEKVFLPRRKRD